MDGRKSYFRLHVVNTVLSRIIKRQKKKEIKKRKPVTHTPPPCGCRLSVFRKRKKKKANSKVGGQTLRVPEPAEETREKAPESNLGLATDSRRRSSGDRKPAKQEMQTTFKFRLDVSCRRGCQSSHRESFCARRRALSTQLAYTTTRCCCRWSCQRRRRTGRRSTAHAPRVQFGLRRTCRCGRQGRAARRNFLAGS